MVMQYRSLLFEMSRSEARRKPSHSSSSAGSLPASEPLSATAKACVREHCPRSSLCDMLLGLDGPKLVKQSKCLPTSKLSIAVFEFFPEYFGTPGNWLSH